MKGKGSRVVRYCAGLLGLMTLGWVLTGQAAKPFLPPLQGIPTDWSHRHLVFSQPATAEQAEQVARDPRYWQQWYRRNVIHGARYLFPLSSAPVRGCIATGPRIWAAPVPWEQATILPSIRSTSTRQAAVTILSCLVRVFQAPYKPAWLPTTIFTPDAAARCLRIIGPITQAARSKPLPCSPSMARKSHLCKPASARPVWSC